MKRIIKLHDVLIEQNGPCIATPVNMLKVSTTSEVKNIREVNFFLISVARRVTNNFLLFCTEHDLQI